MIQKSVSFQYEPSSELLNISVQWLILNLPIGKIDLTILIGQGLEIISAGISLHAWLWFTEQNLEFGVQHFASRIPHAKSRVPGSESQISGPIFQVAGFGFRRAIRPSLCFAGKL